MVDMNRWEEEDILNTLELDEDDEYLEPDDLFEEDWATDYDMEPMDYGMFDEF